MATAPRQATAQHEGAAPPPGLAAEVAARAPWFHNLHLPGGVQTVPEHFLGGDFPSFKWRQIAPHVPADLSGWTVLDVGCNAGFYSFELARRGARVTAVDLDPHYLDQARWAAGVYGLEDRIEFRQMTVYDLARTDACWDLVWFMGVLYHLRHPLLALDLLRQRTRRMMVMQTLTMPGREAEEAPADLPIDSRAHLCLPGWPRMAFIERRMAGDPTNWWAPNHACVEAMLRSAGFTVGERIADETWLCTPGQHSEASMVDAIAAELRAATGTAGRA